MSKTVTIPHTHVDVEYHHQSANDALDRMSSSRQFGAKINMSSWRRQLTDVDLTGQNGYAFSGLPLDPGASATLKEGTLVIVVDTSYAAAKWYARDHIKRLEVHAQLMKVTNTGLESLYKSRRKTWAKDILGFIHSNQHLCPNVRLTPPDMVLSNDKPTTINQRVHSLRMP